MAKIRIMIVDDYTETRENVKRLLYFEDDMEIVGEAGDGKEAVEKAEKLRPDIILMDINMPVMDGIEATEIISLRVPTAAIIIMSVQGEQEYLKKAMIAGAREYMIKPFSSDELTETIRRVYELEKKRRVNLQMEDTAKKREPQVVVVFSTKGGVGKTTIATNLAVALAQESRGKVVLVDLDLQFGDVAVMMNIVPRRTITELVQEIAHLDKETMESYLIEHPSGIKVLPAPSRPEYAELIIAAHVEKIINQLKEEYDYIVIDTPPFFHETNLTALDMCNQILLILALDLPTIKNVKLSLEVLDSLHHKGKVKLVLNRSSGDIGISYQDVEKSLGMLVAAHIPSDGRVVVAAVNRGIPFVVSDPRTKITQAVRELAHLVISDQGYQEDLQKKEKKGVFSRWFG